MNRMLKRGGLALLVSLSLGYALAAPTTVVNQSIWKQVGLGATWVIPADLTGIGCGAENEPVCQPHGQFAFNKPFAAGVSGYYTLVESGGTLSDQVIFGNSVANGNNGVILFASDPTLATSGELSGHPFLGILCTENAASGCVSGATSLAFTDLSTITFTAASDGTAPFDPFHAGFDTSDGISITGASVVPEPSSLPMSLLLMGVIVLAPRVFRRLRVG